MRHMQCLSELHIYAMTAGVLIFLGCFGLTLGSGSVEIKLIQFRNDARLDLSGRRCDSSIPFFPGNCDTYFIICYKASGTTSGCDVQYKTGVYDNTNSITFSSILRSNIANPLTISFSGLWQGSFSLQVEAWDSDSGDLTGSGDDRLDIITFKATNVSISSSFSSPVTVAGSRSSRPTSLVLQYRVVCDANFYQLCSVYCKPRNDSLGHYTCGNDGTKICLSGWTGVECNITVTLPTTETPKNDASPSITTSDFLTETPSSDIKTTLVSTANMPTTNVPTTQVEATTVMTATSPTTEILTTETATTPAATTTEVLTTEAATTPAATTTSPTTEVLTTETATTPAAATTLSTTEVLTTEAATTPGVTTTLSTTEVLTTEAATTPAVATTSPTTEVPTTETSSCRPGCNGTYGYCILPTDCLCTPGWKGYNCDQCIKLPGCVNGFCVYPNDCVCNDGWKGVLCDEAVVTCPNQIICAAEGVMESLSSNITQVSSSELTCMGTLQANEANQLAISGLSSLPVITGFLSSGSYALLQAFGKVPLWDSDAQRCSAVVKSGLLANQIGGDFSLADIGLDKLQYLYTSTNTDSPISSLDISLQQLGSIRYASYGLSGEALCYFKRLADWLNRLGSETPLYCRLDGASARLPRATVAFQL